MDSSFLLAITALVTALGVAVKQIWDNKALRKWVCTRDPCDNRIQGEPVP